MRDSWATMVNTPLLLMFQKSSSMANSNATGHGQMVDLAAAKFMVAAATARALTDPRSSAGLPRATYTTGSSGSSSVNNGVTNNDVYGDDGDLIPGHHAPGVGRVPSASSRSGGGLRNGGDSSWSCVQSPALSNNSGHFGGSDDGSSAMAAAHQQAALAGLGMGGFNF
jgi:hypothetical protein